MRKTFLVYLGKNFSLDICLSLSLGLIPGFAFAETGGSARFEARDFYEGQVGPVQHYEDLLTLNFDGKYNLYENARVVVGPQVKLTSSPGLNDAPGHIGKWSLKDSTFASANFRDTYFEQRVGEAHFQIGSMIKAWEGPDGYNPMDIATVKDFSDPLSPENLGSIGISASGGIEKFSWDAVYIPRQSQVRLPGERSRWLPRHPNLSLGSEDGQLLLPAQPQYIEDRHQILNAALDNNFGARLQYHLTSWDFSGAYFEGAAQVPGLAPTISGDAIAVGPPILIQATNPIEIQAVEYRRRTLAFGIVASGVESWIFRLAGRYDIPVGSNAAVPHDTSQFVGSAEKTATLMGQTVIASLGYAFGQKFETHSGDFTILDPFSSAWMFGMRWPFTETLTLQAYGLWSPAAQSVYYNIHLDKKITDHWTVDGGMQWMDGPGNSPMGIWADQDRASAAATYLF